MTTTIMTEIARELEEIELHLEAYEAIEEEFDTTELDELIVIMEEEWSLEER